MLLYLDAGTALNCTDNRTKRMQVHLRIYITTDIWKFSQNCTSLYLFTTWLEKNYERALIWALSYSKNIWALQTQLTLLLVQLP